MINTLGKVLVMVNTTACLLLMMLAVVIYTNAVDWGWKDPRKQYYDPADPKGSANERAASEIDRRLVVLEQANDNRERAKKRVEKAQADLAKFEGKFAENHLVYAAELDRLYKADGKIEVKEIKSADVFVPLEPNEEYGRPKLDSPVPGVEKSYASYLADLAIVQDNIQKGLLRNQDLTEQRKKITIRLTGPMDKDGKKLGPGYHDLKEIEAVAQKKLKEEIDYLQPLWVRELFNAQLLTSRMKSLEQRLRELGDEVKK